MKKVISSTAMRMQKITAAESVGTTFYKITDKMLKQIHENDENFVMRYLVDKYGFEAFELDKMYGSFYDDENNVFYLLVTDGKEIQIKGKELDPEYIFDEQDITLEDIQPFVQDANKDTVKRYFSSYELKPIDIDDVAAEVMETGSLFTTTIKELYELDLIDLDDVIY